MQFMFINLSKQVDKQYYIVYIGLSLSLHRQSLAKLCTYIYNYFLGDF